MGGPHGSQAIGGTWWGIRRKIMENGHLGLCGRVLGPSRRLLADVSPLRWDIQMLSPSMQSLDAAKSVRWMSLEPLSGAPLQQQAVNAVMAAENRAEIVGIQSIRLPAPVPTVGPPVDALSGQGIPDPIHSKPAGYAGSGNELHVPLASSPGDPRVANTAGLS